MAGRGLRRERNFVWAFLTAANAKRSRISLPKARRIDEASVLLDAPGRPEGVANPSGRPVLRCRRSAPRLKCASAAPASERTSRSSPWKSRARAIPPKTLPGASRSAWCAKTADGIALRGILLLTCRARTAVGPGRSRREPGRGDCQPAENREAVRTYRDAWAAFRQSLAIWAPRARKALRPKPPLARCAKPRREQPKAIPTIRHFARGGRANRKNFEVPDSAVYGKTGRKSSCWGCARRAPTEPISQGAPASDTDPRVTRRWRSDNTGEFSLTKPRIERENAFTLPFCHGCAPGLSLRWESGFEKADGRSICPNHCKRQARGTAIPAIASADVIESGDRASFSAQTSDISRTGCYIDMLNPSALGNHSSESSSKTATTSLRPPRRVIFTVPGLGMGIAFLRVAPASMKPF